MSTRSLFHSYLLPYSLRVILVGFLFVFGLPMIASAASLSFDRTSGSYPVGSTIVSTITVGSSDKAVNAVSGTVSFPQNLLEVVSLSKSRSLISLWVVEPSFSNSAGTINFEGIILNPGYTGQGGAILTVTYRVKAAGTAGLGYSAASVLANDGLGTEILQSRGSATYQLTESVPAAEVQPAPVVETKPTDAGAPPVTLVTDNGVSKQPVTVVESASHTLDGWSNETTGTFNFALTDDVLAMRLLVDDQPDSVPTVVYLPPISSRTIEDLAEGVSYLHVQYKTAAGWGAIQHYKLQIDTAPPENLTVTNLGDNVFGFTAFDSASGIKQYEVVVDGGESISIDGNRPLYKFTGLMVGEHSVTIRAIDQAGNILSRTETITITEIPLTTTKDTSQETPIRSLFGDTMTLSTSVVVATVLVIVIPSLILLLLTGLLLLWSWRTFSGFKKRLHTEITEARMMVHKSFTLLNADLEVDIESLEKASKKRKLTREEIKILKRLQANIAVSESLITKEVVDIEVAADR